jgi:hypothetical protein
MLVGKIEEHYGTSKEITERQVDEFLKALSESEKKNKRRGPPVTTRFSSLARSSTLGGGRRRIFLR